MTAQETIFSVIKEIREAAGLLSIPKVLSADEMIRLSDIYRHLCELVGDIDLFWTQIKLETDNDAAVVALCDTLRKECDGFCINYMNNKTSWDEQCVMRSLITLANTTAKNKYALQVQAAEEEMNKWDRIFSKYNEITRLFNSMDCRPGQEQRDMAVIKKYCEELYDLVGHPVRLETVNEEHDEAYQTKKEKYEALKQLNAMGQRYSSELLQRMETSGVLPELYDIVTSMKSSLPQGFENHREKRGRTPKDKEYDAAGLRDLESCFKDNQMYLLFCKCVNREEKPLSGNEIKNIFNLLTYHKVLNPVLVSAEKFGDLMIDRFGKKVNISDGHYVHSGLDNPAFKEKWKDYLGLK